MKSVPGFGSDPGDLSVSAAQDGGVVLVATSELAAAGARLALFTDEADRWSARVRAVRALGEQGGVGTGSHWALSDAEWSLDNASRALSMASEAGHRLAVDVHAAADGYGQAERRSEWFTRAAQSALASALGFALARVGPLFLAGALPTFLGAVWLAKNPAAFTSPMVVELVRRLVSSTDDAATGVVGLPWPAAFVLGEEGLGLHGVGTSAAGIMAAAGSFGYLRETPVTVRRETGPDRTSAPVLPPTGFGDLADRIPQISPGGPQLLIERYGEPDQAEWVVYIGGTVSWSPQATAEPWDLTSNLAAVAAPGSPDSNSAEPGSVNSGSGSYRAVMQAMEQAGIGADDPVIMVGHSQGGLVAAQVAASGAFSAAGIATFGAPTAQLELPPGIPVVFVEHSDDLVPALGGMPHLGPAAGVAVGAAAAVRLTVRREGYANAPVPADQALPAHSLHTYRDTGVLMDESPEPRLGRFRERLTRLVGTQPGTSSRWRGTRVPEP